jgi:hypothetical protein
VTASFTRTEADPVFTLSGATDAEVEAIRQALAAADTAEVNNRIAAISSEATARAVADALKQDAATASTDAERDAAIAAEASARQAADALKQDAATAATDIELAATATAGAARERLALAAVPDALIFDATITRDSNGAVTSADVLWPDGTAGTFTGTPSSAFPGALDGYAITYGALTYTQPTMTRDSNGAVIARPAITVS